MSPEKEYLIICDESDRKGKYFSNFYGGLRVAMSDLEGISARLNEKKGVLGLIREVKWSKTDPTVVARYEELMKAFFDEVGASRIFCRIMFTQNAQVPRRLTAEHYQEEYYILYYQFIKHA